MNDITVADVLSLPIMANARLVAGQSGLNNKIQYVNVLDNLFNDTQTSEFLPKYGENFYLTSLYHGAKNQDYIMAVLVHFVEVNASAVCIIDEYLDALPACAYAFADEKKLPIIFIDKETPYPIIISSIMELKLSYQEAKNNSAILLTLASRECSEEQAKDIIEQLNPNFASNVVAFHCVNTGLSVEETMDISNKVRLINVIRSNPYCFASEYKNGMIIIYSYKTSSNKNLDQITSSLLEKIRHFLPRAVIGISDVHPLLELGEAIVEAATASNSGNFNYYGTVTYRELGVCRLIASLNGKNELNQYYDSILRPLTEYDQKHQLSLIDTIFRFVENDMDYVKASKNMYVHENTIRYRLGKVKKLIPYGSNDLDFQNTLYMFYKISRLKQFT